MSLESITLLGGPPGGQAWRGGIFPRILNFPCMRDYMGIEPVKAPCLSLQARLVCVDHLSRSALVGKRAEEGRERDRRRTFFVPIVHAVVYV